MYACMYWLSVAFCLFFLFWIGWFCCCPKTSESYTYIITPSIRDVDQPTNQDDSLTDVVTNPQSVQSDVIPKQYQPTCPSYNELLREMQKYDLENPPPSYEQCKNDEMIPSASRILTEVTPVTHEPLRLAINCDPENQMCQVDDNSLPERPEEIGMSATNSDRVMTLSVRFDANDPETQSITSSQNP